MVQVEGYPYYLNHFLHSHFNINSVHKMELQALICVYGYVVDGRVPEGGVELKLEVVQFGDGEKKSAHYICLDKSAITLFLQGVIAVLCLFVAFYQGVISADIFILVDSLYRIFVDALLNEACDHVHLPEEFLAFVVNRSGIHQLVADEPAILKECLSVNQQLA